MNQLTFIGAEHELDQQIEMTEDFVGAMTPPGFKDGVQLYPHQATVVQALVDVEDRRVLTIATDQYDVLTNMVAKLETSAMVLSEPFGSGKTIEILALILIRPVPKAYPVHANSIIAAPTREIGFTHEVTRRFTGPRALIRPTLIIVGSSVLVQWETAVRTFTHLRCFVISDYYKLREFYALYTRGQMGSFDIILLKNGTVTGNFVLPGEVKSSEYRCLISTVSAITAQSCWARIVYDDFDSISIPPLTETINALFTVYVSATRRKTPGICAATPIKYGSIIEALRARRSRLSDISRDKALFTNMNIRNTAEFVDASTGITVINGFRYVYDNSGDNYIRLIGVIGDDEADAIMEMLNGDAINTAAEVLGIKTNSIAEIFRRLLDKKYDSYLRDQNILAILDTTRLVIEGLAPPQLKSDMPAVNIPAVRASILRGSVPHLTHRTNTLDALIAEMTAEFRIAKEADGIAISRMIDNIKEGECQVCKLPLDDFDAFIVRCCGLIVCDECGIKGNRIQRRHGRDGPTIQGACANCKAVIDPAVDLIFIDRAIDLDALINARGDESAELIIESTTARDTPAEPVIKNPKHRALLAIIRGHIAERCEPFPLSIPNLIHGRVNKPAPDTQPRKVLVFANHNETLNDLDDFLTERGIVVSRLSGTSQMKASTVRDFHTHGDVLLINSQQNCAGLNLQRCSTDLVFMHKILDVNIESQVAGRVQRIGREYNARIHYLAYRNEVARM